MRVLLAPNAFKGTFSPVRVAEIWEAALREVPDLISLSRPLSDGGDGALDVWEALLPVSPDGVSSRAGDDGRPAAAVPASRQKHMRVWFVARDPLDGQRRVPVLWMSEDHAGFVESALTCGLALVPPASRDPLSSTTFGCGQLVLGLSGLGAQEVTIGLGGSATCDGGMGLARALGYRFVSEGGEELRIPAELPRLARIIPPEARPCEGLRLRALCDVRNPLLGPQGAARVFAPQKFAPDRPPTEQAIAELALGLQRLAERASADLGVDLVSLAAQPGAGAAGGLGLGLAVFAGASLESGAEHFLRLAGIPELFAKTADQRIDLVLTGEGSYDAQSVEGKVTGELRALCQTRGIPLAIVAGKAQAAGGELVLTAETLGITDGILDERALAALALEAVRRCRPPSPGLA
jgi:glycerate kinase